jgi:hypothetical protein
MRSPSRFEKTRPEICDARYRFGLHFRNGGGWYTRSVSNKDSNPKAVLSRVCGVDTPAYAEGKNYRRQMSRHAADTALR